VRLKDKKEAIESGKIIIVKIFNREDSIAMESITHNKRYLPHELKTRVHSVELYRKTKDINFVCRRYHISKASFMRWDKRYDNRLGIIAIALTVGILTHIRMKSLDGYKTFTEGILT
jgi:hypothetical protein